MKLVSGRWEHIPCDDDYSTSYRLKVPGGWVIRSRASYGTDSASVHHVFVKDPKHTWELEDGQTAVPESN